MISQWIMILAKLEWYIKDEFVKYNEKLLSDSRKQIVIEWEIVICCSIIDKRNSYLLFNKW
jgi:hypothetical protein